MPSHWGPGPVFTAESLQNARRPGIYAGRSLFVLSLLAALTFVWVNRGRREDWRPGSVQELASVADWFYHAVTMLGLCLSLLVAPAASAGAICLDRTRGCLAHLLVTDLSDLEIVLGKLAARLAPVVGLLACGLPVAALVALMGGIDPVALTWAFVVCVTVALVGASLAMTVSIWANRPQDASMTVLACGAAALLAAPLWANVYAFLGLIPPPDWFLKLNPFCLVIAPYAWPGYVTTFDHVVFLLVALAVSAAFNGVTIFTLRRSLSRTNRTPRRRRAWLPRGLLLPGPGLDTNPVAWREWHRTRPSQLMRFVWTVFAVMAIVGTACEVHQLFHDPRDSGAWWALITVVLEVGVGLLLASILAPSSLGEERACLETLLATPLSTRAIVVGKWLGAFRIIPWVALGPVSAASVFAFFIPSRDLTTSPYRWGPEPGMAGLLDRLMIPILLGGLVLAHGAVITGWGLALAIWVRRTDRAVALSLFAYLAAAVGWPVLDFMLLGLIRGIDFNTQPDVAFTLLGLSPPVGSALIAYWWCDDDRDLPGSLWTMMGTCILMLSALAAALVWFCIATFDRRMGRVGRVHLRRLKRQETPHPTPPPRAD